MSFTFNWPRFSDQFHYDAIQMLNTALNKGNKPPIIADKIEVVELEMGTQPPELEIRDIGDLTVDQFRGIFRLTYAGDAHLVLKTKVQANPLNHKQPDIHLMGGSRGMLAAKDPLVVPMLLRLSHFRLSSYVVLVVSKQKGITLVFKTDPLQSVDINSTFDSIAVIQNFIQREIEGQLRQMFREDLPGIIHRLSQQWVKAKVEAPYLNKQPSPMKSAPPPLARRSFDAMSASDTFPLRRSASDAGIRPHLTRQPSHTSFSTRRTRPTSASGTSVAGSSRSHQRFAPPTPSPLSPPVEPPPSSHPDLENFDPTYGLRPEGLPTKSVFRGFSSLFTPDKGLADLTEESDASASELGEGEYDDDEYEEEGDSFDFVDWTQDESPVAPYARIPSSSSTSVHNHTEPEYETIPAIGGGTITRPRIYHSQSLIQSGPLLSKSLGALPTRSYSQTMMTMGLGLPLHMHSHSRSGATTPLMSPNFAEYSGNVSGPSSSRLPQLSLRRSSTPDSLESQPSRSSSGPSTRRTVSTDLTDHASGSGEPSSASATSPIYMRRRMSVVSNTTATSTANGTANVYSHDPHRGHMRSPSASSTSFLSTSPTSPSHHHMHSSHHDPATIVLRPSLNNDSIHQLSTLSHSNHTLSPYTRDLSHFTVRSVPPRPRGSASGLSAQQGQHTEKPRARRKRIYRLGGKKPAIPPDPTAGNGNGPAASGMNIMNFDPPVDRFSSSSPTPPSEFDVTDMDRYFPPSNSSSAIFDDGSKTVRARKSPMTSATAVPSQYPAEVGAHRWPSAKSIF